MNSVWIAGGLGNQMFQYALYRKLNAIGNQTLCNIKFFDAPLYGKHFELEEVFDNVNLKFDDEDFFNERKKSYKKNYTTKESRTKNYEELETNVFFLEKGHSEYDSRVYQLKNSAIMGYWQTEKYFRDISDIIRKDFAFKKGENKLHELIQQIRTCNSVSVHFRRGDYLLPENNKMFGGICTDRYYEDAISYMQKKMNDIKWVFISDDIEWVRSNYKFDDAVYITENMFDEYKNWYDMCIISNCKHNIIANSSFSWWGAWLNNNSNKIVVAPSKWLNGEDTPDVWCDGWIRI